MDNYTSAALVKRLSLTINQSGLNNQTTLHSASIGRKLMIAFISVFAIITLLLNGLVVTSFVKCGNLGTAFNTYVINLAIIDVFSALISMPSNIIREIFGQWPVNGLICSIVLFINQMVNSGNRAAHLLIAANRLWAVTFPFSYRNRHTKRLAIGVILFAWTLITCFVTPEVVLGRRNINYSLSAGDSACILDTSSYKSYHMTFNVLIYNMPEILILASYPWIAFKLRRKLRNNVGVLPVRSGRQDTHDSGTSAALSSSKTDIRRRMILKDAGHLDAELEPEQRDDTERQRHSYSQSVIFSGQAIRQTQENTQSTPSKPSSRSKGHNRLFTYLVVSLICCWTPNHVFFLWSAITGLWNVPVFIVQFFLAYANSWLNPILICLADLRLRKAVYQLIKCC